MLYIFIFAIAIVSIAFSIIARNKINECINENERRIVKAGWRLICGLLGGTYILLATILLFTIF